MQARQRIEALLASGINAAVILLFYHIVQYESRFLKCALCRATLQRSLSNNH